jgi:hypothetical protein
MNMTRRIFIFHVSCYNMCQPHLAIIICIQSKIVPATLNMVLLGKLLSIWTI